MTTIQQHIASIRKNIPVGVTLVCVSKFHANEAIMEAYDCGERDFGESRVQELLPKYEALPKDIRWHFIIILAHYFQDFLFCGFRGSDRDWAIVFIQHYGYVAFFVNRKP